MRRLCLLNETVVADGPPEELRDPAVWLRAFGVARSEQLLHTLGSGPMIEFFTEPWQHVFMQRAFLVVLMSGVVCGVIGSHVALRGMAFIGDAVAHAVFPGIAIAFVLQTSLVVGGIVAGLITAFSVAVVLAEPAAQGGHRDRRVLRGRVRARHRGDEHRARVRRLAGVVPVRLDPRDQRRGRRHGRGRGAVLLLVSCALHKEFVTVGLDRETARSVGLPIFWLDMALYAMVTIAIVISIQAVGNILVLALLITPAACARLLTDRIGRMMLLAP